MISFTNRGYHFVSIGVKSETSFLEIFIFTFAGMTAA